MRLLHISDLHLGKRVNEFSMIEDQKYILTKIINIIDEKKIECVLIAGDVYDKPVPPVEAVTLFDDFLERMLARKIKVFIISGNHDSAERIAFGARLMEKSDIYFSPVYNGNIKPIELEDTNGKLNIYMMPFIKPAKVRSIKEDDGCNVETYTDACRYVIQKMNVNTEERNIIIAHQFVIGAALCESEEHSIGGLDSVEASVFDNFDYVALGHIHGPQKIGRETVRYSGTPLKYSFSEINHKKSVVIIDMEEKGNINIETTLLKPKRDMYELRGTFDEIMDKNFYEHKDFKDGYLHIILTDEQDIPEAIGKLRVVYPNIMKLEYDNTRTRNTQNIDSADNAEHKTPQEIFEELYEKQNNQKMNQKQIEFLNEIINAIKGEE